MVKSVLVKMSPVQKRNGFLQQSYLLKWWSSFGWTHRVGVECPRIVHQKKFSHPEDEGSPFLWNVEYFTTTGGRKPKCDHHLFTQPPQKPKNSTKISMLIFLSSLMTSTYVHIWTETPFWPITNFINSKRLGESIGCFLVNLPYNVIQLAQFSTQI